MGTKHTQAPSSFWISKRSPAYLILMGYTKQGIESGRSIRHLSLLADMLESYSMDSNQHLYHCWRLFAHDVFCILWHLQTSSSCF